MANKNNPETAIKLDVEALLNEQDTPTNQSKTYGRIDGWTITYRMPSKKGPQSFFFRTISDDPTKDNLSVEIKVSQGFVLQFVDAKGQFHDFDAEDFGSMYLIWTTPKSTEQVTGRRDYKNGKPLADKYVVYTHSRNTYKRNVILQQVSEGQKAEQGAVF